MGIKGISLSETKDFVSQYDKGEPKTTWKLGVLDSDIFDLFGGNTDNRLQAMTEAVRYGLKGIENFKVDEKDVQFTTVSRVVGSTTYKVVADSIMRIIPPEVKYELANEILKLSQLSSEEIKN